MRPGLDGGISGVYVAVVASFGAKHRLKRTLCGSGGFSQEEPGSSRQFGQEKVIRTSSENVINGIK